MEGLSSEVKSARLPTFDGTLDKFPVWWTRFEAFAVVHKFEKAIRVNGPDSDLPASDSEAIDENTEDGKKKSAAKKRNAIAMAHLSMAFTKEATMRLIYKAKSQAWPGGLAHEVVKGLFKKYRPIDTMTLVELRQALGKVSMKQKDDPAVIFEQIGSIENRYMDGTRTIPDEELIAVVLSAAPEEYAPVLTTEQRIRGNALSLEDLEPAMTVHYRKLSCTQEKGQMTVIRKTATKLDYRRSIECASSVAKPVTRQITAIRKMPVACPTNLRPEARVAIPTRTCNAMDVVRLVTSRRTAGKRNPMHTSDHQDGNHPKKLEL